MNTSVAQQFFHTWHTAYGSEGNDHEFGSKLWLQYMVQELLDRMLPYVDVTVTEEDDSKNVSDGTHWRQKSTEQLFQFVKAISLDLLRKISVLIYTKVLGYELPDTVTTAVNAMNGEEIEYYGASCTIVFHAFADVTVSVFKNQIHSNYAASLNRMLLKQVQQEFPSLCAYCVYQHTDSHENELTFESEVTDTQEFATRHFIEKFKDELSQSTSLYFTAIECDDMKWRTQLVITTKVPKNQRNGDFYKESCWDEYCNRLCNELIEVSYHTILGDLKRDEE